MQRMYNPRTENDVIPSYNFERPSIDVDGRVIEVYRHYIDKNQLADNVPKCSNPAIINEIRSAICKNCAMPVVGYFQNTNIQ